MISKSKQKLIRSLEQKKFRRETGLFVAEGPKVVGDLYPYYRCHLLAATSDWLQGHLEYEANEIIEVTREELGRLSFLKTPQSVLALFEQVADGQDDWSGALTEELCLALDDVQDPGNLGTIIRLADWFGVGHIFCSPGCSDAYSPKTVQATMGSLARVKVHYLNLPELIRSLPTDVPVYGTSLQGDNLYDMPLENHGLLVMGNEGRGVSQEVDALVNKRLYIPNYPEGQKTGESLNVAVATAVVCAELRRRGRMV